jgi:hypothetical protein
MFDESMPDIDKTTEKREYRTTVDDVAHWAGMGVNETRDILSHFATQRRVEMYTDRIVVKNINDFSRFVSSRRKKA